MARISNKFTPHHRCRMSILLCPIEFTLDASQMQNSTFNKPVRMPRHSINKSKVLFFYNYGHVLLFSMLFVSFVWATFRVNFVHDHSLSCGAIQCSFCCDFGETFCSLLFKRRKEMEQSKEHGEKRISCELCEWVTCAEHCFWSKVFETRARYENSAEINKSFLSF